MIIGKIEVSCTTATVTWSTEIPKGLVGGKVQITYTDDIWANLNKTVVFRGAVTKDVLDNGNEVVIPAEVLSRSGINLYVGVYGTNAENKVGIPTFWAKLGVIRDAADPNDDPLADPSLPVWAKLLERTPDWQAPPSSDNHILNRTHWKELHEAHNVFDGSLDGRTFYNIEDGYTFVKISSRVLTLDDLIGSTVVLYNAGDPPDEETIEVTEDFIYDLQMEMGYPVLAVSELIMCVQSDFSLYGLFIEKGVYFLRAEQEGELLGYVKSISALPDNEEVFHKLDSQYIDADWLAGRSNGHEVVLAESVQPFYSGNPATAKQSFLFKLEVDQQYEVHWDGEVYPCHVRVVTSGYIIGYFLGNAHFLDTDYPDTGEPFCIIHVTVMGIPLITEIASVSEEAEEHTVAIYATGNIRKRLPYQYLPADFIFPNDLYDSGIDNDYLEQAYFHMLNGGTVYANYSDNRFRVLAINLDLWDSRFHSLVMTNGECLMMWSSENGWLKQCQNSFMLNGYDGRKYRIGISSGQFSITDATNESIYV